MLEYQTFRNRSEAGKKLAQELQQHAENPDVVVLGLPRGGVPVAYEVARALSAPLDVFLVRKLGVPGHSELAMGAIASGGVQILNEEVTSQTGVTDGTIERTADLERAKLERRAEAYRGDRPDLELEDKVVILIDDGIATGATMSAAVAGLKQLNPRQIVVAVPAAAPSTCADFRAQVDEVVCLITPGPYQAVGAWYQEFGQTSNDQVRQLLNQANVP